MRSFAALAGLAAATMLPGPVNAQLGNLPADVPIAVSRVTDRLIVLEKAPYRMFALRTPRGIVFFDTEPTDAATVEAVRLAKKELGRKDVAFLIDTHEHHALANGTIAGVPIVGSDGVAGGLRELLENLSANRAQSTRVIDLARAERDSLPVGSAAHGIASARIAYAEAIIAQASRPAAVPDVTFNDRLTLRLGDRTIQLIAMPRRHSQGDAFVVLPEERVLLTGGIVSPRGYIPGLMPDATAADIRRWIDVLTELSAGSLKLDRVLQGHGAELKVTDLVFARDYYDRMLREFQDARKRGLTVEQAKQELSLENRFRDLLDAGPIPEASRETHEGNIETFWKMKDEPAMAPSSPVAPGR